MQLRFLDCVVDTAAVELRREGVVVALEPLVYKTLVMLVENAERAPASCRHQFKISVSTTLTSPAYPQTIRRWWLCCGSQ